MSPSVAVTHWMQQQTDRFEHHLLAYSAGLDSQVLAHILSQISPKLSLRLIHVNHRVQPDAQRMAEFARSQAEQLGCSIEVIELHHPTPITQNIEAQLRTLRYEALRGLMTPKSLLLSAHHLDDQAETWLLKSLRGQGVKGLAGIASFKQFASGHLGRPLLGVKKSELLAYAQHHGLSWWEDVTNEQQRFDRNYIRHHILPQLEERFAGCRQSLAQAAKIQADTLSLLNEVAAEDLSRMGGVVTISGLKALSAPRRSLLVRYFLEQSHCPMPSAKQLETFIGQLITARPDKHPRLAYGDVILSRHHDNLLLFSSTDTVPVMDFEWLGQACLLSDGSTLTLERLQAAGIHSQTRPLWVRYRPFLKQGHRSVKRWLNEQKIPLEQRDSTPLIFKSGQFLGGIKLLYPQVS